VRAATRLALPLVALTGLAVLGPGRSAPLPVATEAGSSSTMASLVRATRGSGALEPTVIVRVVTDGHPQLVSIPVRPVPQPRPHPVEARPQAVRHPVAPHRPRGRAVAPAPAPADAYPYATDASGGNDPWGFTMRQCVSYVAWRLAVAGRPLDNATQGWGSALDWDDTARRLGRTVSSTPRVGAVAQWDAHEAGAYWSAGSARPNGTFVAGKAGHVAWVLAVYGDGSVLVAQYNGTASRAFSTMRVKAPRYLLL
jgi:surface antigen